MQLISWKSFSLLFVMISLSANLQAQKEYFETDQKKIQAIEHLWMEQGVPEMIKKWAGNDKKRQDVASHFYEHHAGQIEKDRIEFFAFVQNPKVLYPALEQPTTWLMDKKASYTSQLNAFSSSPVPSSPGGGIPPPIFIPGVTPSSYTPNPILSSQCGNYDMDSMLATWSTDTGYVNETPNPPLYGHYTPGLISFHADKKIQSYHEDSVGLLYDPLVGGTILPKIYPGPANHWSIKLENYENGNGLSHISKKFTVDASKPWIVYRYAVILQDPGDHPYDARPFFEAKITDASDSSIPCAYYKVVARPPIANFAQIGQSSYYYRDWTSVVVPLDDYIGQVVTLHFTVGDCSYGGHLAYAYVDGSCLDDDLTLDANCNPNQVITAPKGFDYYHWTGEEIPGDNYRNTLNVKKAGLYHVDLITVTGCEVSRQLLVPTDCPDNIVYCTMSNMSAVPGPCDPNSNTYSVSGSVNIGSISDGFLLVTAGNQSKIYRGPFSGSVNYVLDGLPANGKQVPVSFKIFTSRHFSSYTLSCEESLSYTAPEACGSVTFECEDCIKGFMPTADSTYVISVWVKKDGASPLDYEYTDPFVKIGFHDGSTWTYQTYYAAGEIIEGWQRIANEFLVPLGTIEVSIQLGTNTNAAYFDDLRIYPANGSFKSFVYDPITLRLVAELDENNYATYYEYDEEGALIRIKKETERGVMTIQENRNYKVKRP